MIKKKFNTLCMTFTNSYNKETFIELVSILEKFDEKSKRAMAKYLISPPSTFLDWSYLMKLIRDEYRISLKLLNDKNSYGVLMKDISEMGSRKKQYDPITERTIKQMGGWKYLCNTPNSNFLAKQWYALYNENLNRYILKEMNV